MPKGGLEDRREDSREHDRQWQRKAERYDEDRNTLMDPDRRAERDVDPEQVVERPHRAQHEQRGERQHLGYEPGQRAGMNRTHRAPRILRGWPGRSRRRQLLGERWVDRSSSAVLGLHANHDPGAMPSLPQLRAAFLCSVKQEARPERVGP